MGWAVGRKQTKEHRLKISAALKGRMPRIPLCTPCNGKFRAANFSRVKERDIT